MAHNRFGSHHTPFVVQIDEPILVCNQTYVLEPPLTEITRRLWYSNALVLYSIADTVLAFMGPLPSLVRKSGFSEKIFPIYHEWEPVIFYDQPFDFRFLEKHVYFSPLLEAPDSSYITYLNKVEKRRKLAWKKLGIFDLIQLSRVHLKYNPAMLLVVTCFWESTTKTFHLPCGMLTPSLFDPATIAGLQPTGED